MKVAEKLNINFEKGLIALGFYEDESLFLTNSNLAKYDPQIKFHLEKARKFNANAVCLRRLFNGNYKPQAYLFDFTQKGLKNAIENEIALAQKRIWSSGEAPLACFFFDTEIKIVDCTRPVNKIGTSEYSPVYLEEHLEIASKVHHLYNEQFAIKLKSGVFWDEQENKNRFKFLNNSAYDILISWIKKVTESLKKENSGINKQIINKIIIQSILIKYLEEKKDENERNPFGDIYFNQFENSKHFTEVLRKRQFVELLEKLNTDFNGNLFVWDETEKAIIRKCNLGVLADALEGLSHPDGQLLIRFDDIRLYEFNYIPVELISRLYEEFLAGDVKEEKKKKNKQEEGIYYTPSHLAKLLIDEAMPLINYNEVDLKDFKILDPACGSGIFLVLAFKRLVQWWRLKNGLNAPRTSTILKELQKCVYGTDKEEQATQLAAFSLCLALCDELSPMQIINELRFDDLTQTNILHTDFFVEELIPKNDQDSDLLEKQKANFKKINGWKYNLIIGNPPFKTGGIKNYRNVWCYQGIQVRIPQGQIALKFLAESLPLLQENGVQCLIIKSSGLLYNSSSEEYKKLLFSNFNVVQIFDFTSLARNKALWDNGADVASAAIFIRNFKPDYKKNILHVTFRRTKAIRERIVFEIDDYDLHYVNRITAINSGAIWKNNLLGGGRIRNVIEKLDQDKFCSYLEETNSVFGEGFKVGSSGKLKPGFIYEIPTLPTEAIDENAIDYNRLDHFEKDWKFEKIPPKIIFESPNIIIKENIGENRIPIFLNNKDFSFQHKIIGISNKENPNVLTNILDSFEEYNDFYRFFIFVTSGQVLINLNTAILKADIMELPFIEKESDISLSHSDYRIIDDVNTYFQDFIRHGERSKAVQPVTLKEYEHFMKNYGTEFSSVLNLMYEEGKKKFRLSDVVSYDNSFIATVFKYDDKDDEPLFHKNQTNLDIIGLSNYQVSKHLTTKRIIKLYPQKDTIVFIKPNQYRFWLSLIAYRDADKCFIDLANAGY
ncbi:MAG: N-6 DNA methylase [Prolixibacteraceae bacterium]|nr:N-6 DNA methylase [Prolixibacteraceae bacterium]